jgi:DNA topoisomerase-1
VKAEVEIDGTVYEAEYEKKIIETKREATTVVEDCKGKNGQIDKIDIKRFHQPPPTPFDLGSLQNEAYRLFGYTPMRTSNIAQHLYLEALISYPRTSSQKLPPTINYKAILRSLGMQPEYKNLADELLTKPQLQPNEGSKEDPAHPAIYPTGNILQKTLESAERNVWNLVIHRFMAVFGDSALVQSIKASIQVNGHHFSLRGKQTLEQGWQHFYKPYIKSKEVPLPPLTEGQIISVKRVALEDKFTKPPNRYNPSSLLRKMEESEIGTKATRAGIIQTLYERKYVKDVAITATDLGFEILETLKKYCPTIVSTKLTKQLEEKMVEIQANNEKGEHVLAEVVEILKPAMKRLKENEMAIGEQLSNAVRKGTFEERIIGNCPTCKDGNLVIIYSRKTRKRFVGCTNYFKGACKTAFPLPQRGMVTSSGRNCRMCGWPTAQLRMKGRRPWTLCFNVTCPSKEKWRQKKAELQNLQ